MSTPLLVPSASSLLVTAEFPPTPKQTDPTGYFSGQATAQVILIPHRPWDMPGSAHQSSRLHVLPSQLNYHLP
jgi:hypothetical protein